MASKKKSTFAMFLIIFAAVMMVFLSVLKNDVPVPLFIVFSLGLLYTVGFAVYMICKNRTLKWFFTTDAAKKTKATSSASKSSRAVSESKETQTTQRKSRTTSKKSVASKKPANVEAKTDETPKAKSTSTKAEKVATNVKPVKEVSKEQET